MRPVNLLPASERPRQAATSANGANITVGVLAALLVAVLAVVLTQNQVTSRKDAASKSEQEAQTAETRATALASYGTFVQTKDARVQSVTGLADARFDWERFMRELALVLPEGTSILSATGSTAGTDDAASTTASAATAASTGAAGSPTVSLTGCATAQPRVAVLMVRLRRMYRVSDVQLTDSTQSGAGSGGGTSGAGGDGCASSRYQFQVAMTFSAEPAKSTGKQRKVSGSLGGGA